MGSTSVCVFLFALAFILLTWGIVCIAISVHFLFAFTKGEDTGFSSFAMFMQAGVFSGLGCSVVKPVLPYLSVLQMGITAGAILYIETVVILILFARYKAFKIKNEKDCSGGGGW